MGEFTGIKIDELVNVIDDIELKVAKLPNTYLGNAYRQAVQDYRKDKQPMKLVYLMNLKRTPVSLREFVTSPKYLDMQKTIYPKVLDNLEELCNPGGDRLGVKYYEAVLTGGIGSGKTTLALIALAYQLYLLSCFHSPSEMLGQDYAAEILIVFQSLNAGVARDVDYKRFRNMIERSPYFREKFSFRKDISSVLIFPSNIEVKPVTGDVAATIGQNIWSALIDEVNFMEVVKKSTKMRDEGVFDQARELYESMHSRRVSRFLQMNALLGLVCLSSSQHYPEQFTDKKIEQAKTDPGIWVYDKRVWDVRGRENYPGEWFKIFVGDATRKPYIIDEHNPAPKDCAESLIDEIPETYKHQFKRDIYRGLREIAGRATLAKSPYMPNLEAINYMMKRDKTSIFSRDDTDFRSTQLMVQIPKSMNLTFPRYAHVDLGLTGDAAGIAVGHVDKFEWVEDETMRYQMPRVVIDGLLSVRPPVGGEINFGKIRKIFTMITKLGIHLKWVSFDSFQSVDSIQILRSMGYMTGTLSLDKDSLHYDLTKDAVNDGRVVAPVNELLRKELSQLERTDKGKIDHPDGHGCFVGSTEVLMADGSYMPIEDMLDYQGGPLFVRAWDGVGSVPAFASHPRITKYTTDLVEVCLADGSTIRCTPEHKFLLANGRWVEAQNLEEDDDIKSLQNFQDGLYYEA